jgi:hypothetical protein
MGEHDRFTVRLSQSKIQNGITTQEDWSQAVHSLRDLSQCKDKIVEVESFYRIS